MLSSIRFPSPRFAVLSVIVGFTMTKLLAVDLPLDTRPVVPVEGGDSIYEGLNLYATSFDDSAYSPSNPSDIVVFNSVILLTVDEKDEDNDDDDTLIYSAAYKGFNTATKTDQDLGRIFIEAPLDFPSISSSYCVGFLRKSGGWVEKTTATTPMLASVTGTLSYYSLQSTRDIDLAYQGVYEGEPFTVTSSSTATVTSEDMVTVATLTGSEASSKHITFNAVSFSRTGNTYLGFLRRLDDSLPDEWIEKYALARLIDVNDSDGDGIPDFSDLGSEQVLGIITSNSVVVGEGQVWSGDLNTNVSYDPHELWLYGENLGWFYLPDQDDPEKIHIYIPDDNLGWLWTNKDTSPCYIRESDGGLIYFELVDGQVWYYDYSTETWLQPTY